MGLLQKPHFQLNGKAIYGDKPNNNADNVISVDFSCKEVAVAA